jgi:aminopeptidase YwaD
MDRSLYQETIETIDDEAMKKLVGHFSHLHRLTGTPDAQAAAAYIADQLTAYGIAHERHEFEGYFSDPVKSELVIAGSIAETIISKPRSFSLHCPEGVTGSVIYDLHSRGQRLTSQEEQEWYSQFRGKIVLSWNFYEDYVKKIESYGASGLIHIWPTEEKVIHEETVGPVWGTPTLASAGWIPAIPVVGIRKKDGLRLIEKNANAAMTAAIRSWVHEHVAKASLPVAYIPGKTQEYILVSGHYDSWYEGVTDNAVGNAVCLEMARVFSGLAGKLERGIKIAWWPGHSNGRYMGSAWFCDQYWQDLHDHCVAHLNIDSPGSRGGVIVLPRTTRLEGAAFTSNLIKEFTEQMPDMILDIPRGADQSFWGADIPFHLMYKYQPVPEKNIYSCPGSGGGWWWHSEYDSLDKVDDELLIRDARLNIATVFALANAKRLPVDFCAYFTRMQAIFQELDESSDPSFTFQPIMAAADSLAGKLLRLMRDSTDAQANRIIKLAGGRLNRLMYSSGSRYDFDNTFPAKPFPGLQIVAGVHRTDTPAAQFLFTLTSFVRQCNRITNEIRMLERELDHIR